MQNLLYAEFSKSVDFVDEARSQADERVASYEWFIFTYPILMMFFTQEWYSNETGAIKINNCSLQIVFCSVHNDGRKNVQFGI